MFPRGVERGRLAPGVWESPLFPEGRPRSFRRPDSCRSLGNLLDQSLTATTG